jgi:2-polyprenyl-3-methyl-5-hydroxy-6-metoxy-1,4-benzoquinol methylase
MSDIIEKPAHYFNAPRREMLQYIPSNAKKILEIGCGEGYFSAELKRLHAEKGNKLEITAVEIDKERAQIAKQRLDSVICADIEEENLNLANSSFDCIICNDVLEHLVSPWNTLKKLRPLLKPNGVVVASIPNVRYWGVVKDLTFLGEWKYAEEGVLDVTHLRFFTKNSIKSLFIDSGYNLQSIDGINSFVSGWKFELLNKLTRNRFEDLQYLQFAVIAKQNTLT